jgi:hypothetical protein
MNYETCKEIELALLRHFDFRQNIIVPNVSWGLGIHECDMLMVSKNGYATEFEIKVSKADLIKDKEKRHNHDSKKIKYLFFVIPEKLDKEEIINHIPGKAGIIVVKKNGITKIKRAALKNNEAIKLTDKEILHVARLGAMRIYGLKCDLVNLKKYNKELENKLKGVIND